MRKLIFTMIIIMLIAFVSGCQSGINEMQAVRETSSIIGNLSSPIIPVESTQVTSKTLFNQRLHNVEQFTVTPSDIKEGWSKINAKVLLHEVSYYSGQKILSQLDGDHIIEYSMHVPDSWTLTYSVFLKDQNQKIAELFPVTLLKLNEDSQFLNFEEYKERELVSKDKVTFKEYHGLKLILKIKNQETWYSHNYYLTDGIYGFGISIYSYSDKISEDDLRLFNDIASTFSLNHRYI